MNVNIKYKQKFLNRNVICPNFYTYYPMLEEPTPYFRLIDALIINLPLIGVLMMEVPSRPNYYFVKR